MVREGLSGEVTVTPSVKKRTKGEDVPGRESGVDDGSESEKSFMSSRCVERRR